METKYKILFFLLLVIALIFIIKRSGRRYSRVFEEIIASDSFKTAEHFKAVKLEAKYDGVKEVFIYKKSLENYIILIKTDIGYKGNYHGYCYTTIKSNDIIINELNGRTYLSVENGAVFEEIYLKESYENKKSFRVFFDLN